MKVSQAIFCVYKPKCVEKNVLTELRLCIILHIIIIIFCVCRQSIVLSIKRYYDNYQHHSQEPHSRRAQLAQISVILRNPNSSVNGFFEDTLLSRDSNRKWSSGVGIMITARNYQSVYCLGFSFLFFDGLFSSLDDPRAGGILISMGGR